MENAGFVLADDGPQKSNNAANVKPSPSESNLCGYGKCTPPWLQWLHRPWCLVLCLSFGAIAQGFIINGLIPISLSTLERRFRLSSTESGLFAAGYDITVLLPLAVVCHYGALQHKGKWLGFGLILIGVGSLIISLPHFISHPDVHVELSDAKCIGMGNDCENGSGMNGRWYFYALLLLGQLFHGFGASPLYTIGITYIDENVMQKSSAMYIGIFLGLSMLGPALGYLIGGALLKIPGDIGRLTQADLNRSKGYGAWWIGFLIGAAMAFASALPILAFSRQLPGAAKARMRDKDQTHDKTHLHGEAAAFLVKPEKNIRELPRICWRLIRNWPLLCMILMQSSEYFLLTGFVNFMPKVFEAVMSMDASTASLMAGAIMIPCGVIGNILGGYFVKLFKLECRGMILFSLALQVACMPFAFSMLARCSQAPFVGIDNQTCSLSNCEHPCPQKYDPVCGADGKTYFSPCFAACTNFTAADSRYRNCQCVDSSDSYGDVGSCGAGSRCYWQKPLILTSIAIFGLLIFISASPIQQAQLRCVSFQDRTLAIGLSWVSVRLLGSIPGPLIFGAAIDHTCLLWPVNCERRQACAHYNASTIVNWILGFCLFVKVVNLVLLWLAWQLYKAPKVIQSPNSSKDFKLKVESYAYVNPATVDDKVKEIRF